MRPRSSRPSKSENDRYDVPGDSTFFRVLNLVESGGIPPYKDFKLQ